MTEYQVTLIDKTKKYKPVSAIVRTKATIQAEIIKAGAEKICMKRGWTSKELKAYGYTTAKVRVYDKEKIDAEARIRYEKIKEEKYASGEWKRPKAKEDK